MGNLIHGAANAMVSAMQIPEPVETFDHQCQQDQQPDDENAVGLVVSDMFHAIALFAIIEALILDHPAALGHAIKPQAAQLADGEVGEPPGFHHGAIAFVLAVAQHAHGGPVEGFPSIEVIGISNLDAILILLEHGLRRLAIETGAHGGGQ